MNRRDCSPHIAYLPSRPDRPPTPSLVVSGPFQGALVKPAMLAPPGTPPVRLYEVVDGAEAGRECWLDDGDVRPVGEDREEDHRGQC
jgi:hypothetical protein